MITAQILRQKDVDVLLSPEVGTRATASFRVNSILFRSGEARVLFHAPFFVRICHDLPSLPGLLQFHMLFSGPCFLSCRRDCGQTVHKYRPKYFDALGPRSHISPIFPCSRQPAVARYLLATPGQRKPNPTITGVSRP